MAKIGRTLSGALSLNRVMVLFVTLLGVVEAQARVSVNAMVDRNEISISETLTLTVSVAAEEGTQIQDPRVPLKSEFDLIQTGSESQLQSLFLDQRFTVLRNQQFHFQLRPKRIGKFSLGPIEVLVDSKVYKTPSLEVSVVAGQNRRGVEPRKEESGDASEDDLFADLLKRAPIPFQLQPDGVENEPFFISLEMEKREVYVAEEMVVSWYLYTQGNLHEFDALKYPELKDFWKEDIEMPTQFTFQQAIVNGALHRKALIAKYALFPMREGRLEVDAFKAKCKVSFGNFGLFGDLRNVIRSSRPVEVTVRPLPLEGKPEFFSGGVGDFTLKTALEAEEVQVDQPFLLTVTIQGRGNAKLIDLPKIEWPDGIELYEMKDESKYSKDFSSYRKFQIYLIPKRGGNMDLPVIRLAYFDPQRERYFVKESQPLRVTVTGAPSPVEQNDKVPSDSMTEKSVEYNLEPALYEPLSSSRPLTQRWPFWVAFYLVLVIVLLIRAKVVLKDLDQKGELCRRIRVTRKDMLSAMERSEWRSVGTKGVNLIYEIMGHVSSTGGSYLEVSKLFLHSPPSVRRELGQTIGSGLEFFYTLGFGPDVSTQGFRDRRILKKRILELEGTMLRAVDLILSETSLGDLK